MNRTVLRAIAGFGSITLPFVILFGSLFLIPSSQTDFADMGANPVRSLAWSADGRWIAAGSDDATIRVYDAETQQQVADVGVGSGTINSLTFHPQTELLAVGAADGNVYLWDVTTTAKPTILKAHQDAVQQVLWADDGSRLGSKSVDGQIIIWDAEQGRKVSTFSRFDNGLAAAIASSMPDVETVSLNALPSGKGCSKYQLALNNAANQQRILANYAAPVNDAVFSPGHDLLAVARSDSAEVNVWNASTGVLLYSTSCTQATSLAWSPSAEQIAIGAADGQIVIWKPDFQSNGGMIFAFGTIVAVAVGMVCYWLYRRLGAVSPPSARLIPA